MDYIQPDGKLKRKTNPWAERAELGFFRALWETIKQVLLKPGEFFDNLEIKDSLWEPLSFYLTVTTAVLAAIILIFLLFPSKPIQGLGMAGVLLLAPIIMLGVIASLYIGAAIMHLVVLMFGGSGGFKATFNVLAYNAAPGIFSIIPLVGGLINGVWSIVIGVIGFKRVHGLSTLRAVFVYILIPIIIMVVALLAAIAVPNLLSARSTANEAAARATLMKISTAVEIYAGANRRYPRDEFVLKYSQPPYLTDTYNNKTVAGYTYYVDLAETGYELSASPAVCGVTGKKIFKIQTGGAVSEEECKVEMKLGLPHEQ